MVKQLTGRSFSQLLLAVGMVLFSGAVLGLLLYREREVLLHFEWQLNPLPLVEAFLAFCVGLGLAIMTWISLIRRLGSTLPIHVHIDHYGLSQLAKRLPGTLWYLVGRTYLYKQTGESIRLVTFASSLELFIMIVSGGLVTLLFGGYALAEYTPLPFGGWLVLTGLGLLLLHPKPLQFLIQYFQVAVNPSLHYGHLLGWLFMYSLIWISGGSVLFFVSNVVTTIPIANLPYFIGSWSLVGILSMAVFFLPSNLGFTEVGLSLLLANVIASPLAVVAAVANRIFLLGCELIGVSCLLLINRLIQQLGKKSV